MCGVVKLKVKFLYFSDNLFHYRKYPLASDTDKGNHNFKILNILILSIKYRAQNINKSK